MGHRISNDNKVKRWQDTMDEHEVETIINHIYSIIKEGDYEFCDNFRAARLWKSSQRRRYYRDRSEGCCGFYDGYLRIFNFKKMRFDVYMVGFNYGH